MGTVTTCTCTCMDICEGSTSGCHSLRHSLQVECTTHDLILLIALTAKFWQCKVYTHITPHHTSSACTPCVIHVDSFCTRATAVGHVSSADLFFATMCYIYIHTLGYNNTFGWRWCWVCDMVMPLIAFFVAYLVVPWPPNLMMYWCTLVNGNM